MKWIAPSEKDSGNNLLEKRLWEAADKASATARRGGSRIDEPAAYHAEGVIYLTPNARFEHLLSLPEWGNIGQAINEAMADIEKHNPQLAGVLPRTYQIFNSTLLKQLLKKVSEIPHNLEFDAFGRIYEYFLGESTEEREEVKKVAHQLLERLRELLVLGWRQRVSSRARVRLAIEDALMTACRAHIRRIFRNRSVQQCLSMCMRAIRERGRACIRLLCNPHRLTRHKGLL